MKGNTTDTISAYIGQYSGETGKRLRAIRATVKKLAPEAVEGISYGMPAYKLDGKPLVYFSAFAKHIGLYALPTTNVRFKNELAKYKTAKGSIQFDYDRPLPLTLIRKIVSYRVKEVRTKAKKR